MDRKNKQFFVIILLFIFLVIVLFIVNSHKENSKAIENNETLKEIDNLLIPVYNKNITESDFNNLKELVKNDEYASDEVNELILLAKYKEYTHIGHGLGFLYEYVKTGTEPICVGHSLSHYYVFMKHGETSVAKENFEEAKSSLPEWKSIMESQNESYLDEKNYTGNLELITSTISNIESGDLNYTDEKIDQLSEAPCA